MVAVIHVITTIVKVKVTRRVQGEYQVQYDTRRRHPSSSLVATAKATEYSAHAEALKLIAWYLFYARPLLSSFLSFPFLPILATPSYVGGYRPLIHPLHTELVAPLFV